MTPHDHAHAAITRSLKTASEAIRAVHSDLPPEVRAQEFMRHVTLVELLTDAARDAVVATLADLIINGGRHGDAAAEIEVGR